MSTVPAAMPVRERGYSVSTSGQSFWEDLQREKTPELRWPQCIEVYEDMDDQDGQVGSTLAAVVTPILRAGWRVDGTGCRDEVTAHVATDLGLPIVGRSTQAPPSRVRGRFSWAEHLAVAVPDHLQYGHAVFEQVYYPEASDGLLHLRKLGYRPPRTIAAWNVARDGGLISIVQHAPGIWSHTTGFGLSAGPALPVSRLVVYTHRRKGGNWVGRSVLRPAYKNWRLKDTLLRIQTQVADRNGMGIPVYEAAGATPEEIAAGEAIAAGARAGEDTGIAIPHGAEFKLLGVAGQLPDLQSAIRYHDEQIARSMLANVLNLGQARGTGSHALGGTLNDVLSLSIEAIAENIRDTGTKHIVEDLVDINYGPDEPAPRLVFDEIGTKNEAIVAAIAQLVAAGVLQPDEDLETFLRTNLGLPPRGPASSTDPDREAT